MITRRMDGSSTAFFADPARGCAPHPKTGKPVPQADSFFAVYVRDQAEAKKLCFQCPVRVECLMYALKRPAMQGVWGGTTDRERVRMRSRMRETNVGFGA